MYNINRKSEASLMCQLLVWDWCVWAFAFEGTKIIQILWPSLKTIIAVKIPHPVCRPPAVFSMPRCRRGGKWRETRKDSGVRSRSTPRKCTSKRRRSEVLLWIPLPRERRPGWIYGEAPSEPASKVLMIAHVWRFLSDPVKAEEMQHVNRSQPEGLGLIPVCTGFLRVPVSVNVTPHTGSKVIYGCRPVWSQYRSSDLYLGRTSIPFTKSGRGGGCSSPTERRLCTSASLPSAWHH